MVKTTFYANMIRSPRPCKKLSRAVYMCTRRGWPRSLSTCLHLELPVWLGDFTVVTKGVDREEGSLQILRNLENSFEDQMGSQEGGT